MKWVPVTEEHHPVILALRREIEKLKGENDYLRKQKFDPFVVSDDAVEMRGISPTIELPLVAEAIVGDVGKGVEIRAWAGHPPYNVKYGIYLDHSQLNYPADEMRRLLGELIQNALIQIGYSK